jgi:hypothetical protein
MDWIIKYRLIKKEEYISISTGSNWNQDGHMDYLFGQPLNKFNFDNKITEFEFLNGMVIYLINDNNNCGNNLWSISQNLVIKDLKQRRKEKLDGLL